MKSFTLHRETVVSNPLNEVFDFFSKAENLQLLTPAWLKFQIRTSLPIRMQRGTQIEYALRLYGLPFQWKSEITAWEPPYRFIDVQLRGPYRQWIHEHRFQEIDGGARIIDHVTYAVPGGPLAPIVGKLFVRRNVEQIFKYRQQKIQELFPSS